MMKNTLKGLTALLVGAGAAQAAVTADFGGSTADTSVIFPTAPGGLTTEANLNAGTTGGTWGSLSASSNDQTSEGVLVSDGTQNGMTGNWLQLGVTGNDTAHLSEAALTISTPEAVNGTTIAMDLNLLGAGGQDGTVLITGWSAGGRATGTALFQANVGVGGIWGQRDLHTLTTLDTAPGSLVDNNIWGTANANSVNLTFNLSDFASGYTITGADVASSPFSIAGGYFTDIDALDLAVLEFRAVGSKAAIGLDNVSINAVPEPSSAALLGLGGLSLILRRRK